MTERISNPKLGISCVLVGMTAMSLMDAIIKLLSDQYPLHEIVMVRSVIALTLTLFIVHLEGGLQLLRTSTPFFHLARGLLIVTANMTFYLALPVMPIASVIAIFFISPVIITALSVVLLKEKVGWHRWLAVLIGFTGVSIMMRLGTDAFKFTSLLPIVAAFAYSLAQIITRYIGTTEKASVMSFYISAIFIFVSAVFWFIAGDGSFAGKYDPTLDFLLRAWSWPNMEDATKMIAVGGLITIVGYMLSQAYRVAELNIVAPFEYISIPLGVLWGYVFWKEIPDLYTFLGILLVAVSGLYVFFREQRVSAPVDQTYGIDHQEEQDSVGTNQQT